MGGRRRHGAYVGGCHVFFQQVPPFVTSSVLLAIQAQKCIHQAVRRPYI